MKKNILSIAFSIIVFIASSQINLTVSDTVVSNNCDSSLVLLLNETPTSLLPTYYRWEFNGNTYEVGTDQSPFELWVSNFNFNYIMLVAFDDSTYSNQVGIYTHTIITDSCNNQIQIDSITQNVDSVIDCNTQIINFTPYVSGGTAPYYYSWSYNGMYWTVPSPTIEVTDNSTVYLTITDINGYTFNYLETISFTNNISTSQTYTILNSDCNTTTVQFFGFSSESNSTYFWEFSNNVTNDSSSIQNPIMTFDNNQYIISLLSVRSPLGCFTESISTIPLTGSSFQGTYVVTNNSNNICVAGLCDFQVSLVAQGGVAPFSYSLNSSVLSSNATFNNLCAGNYLARIEDANGCYTEFSVIVNDVTGLQVYENSYFSNCDSSNGGNNNSYIQAYVSGSNISTVWNDGFIGYYYPNPSPGTHTYLVTDSLTGCTASGTFVVPSNNCYTISGNVYADIDGDCIFNNNDYAFGNVWVDLTDASGTWLWIYDYTDANGNFSISAPAGTYYFDINGYYVNNFTQNCPASGFSVTIGPSNPNAVVDFFMNPPAPVQDLSVSLLSFTTFTPGFPYWAYISYCNNGTMPMSGNVVMNYDANLTYVANSVAGAVNDAVNHTLTWNFTNLMPGSCGSLQPDFTCVTSAILGTTMSNTAVVNPIAGDATPSNNTAYVIDTVVGSWDPNDKAVYPNAEMTVDQKDHDYTIRFQNKGTAPATFVIVRDDLDNNLDLQTLRNVSASHNFVLTVENTDELVFTFNNIMLPAEQDDEPRSKGSIHFTISQKEDLPLGTVIKNTADIYFDFNEPIITNTTENIIVEKVTSIKDIENTNTLNVYPNPTSGLINVATNNNSKIKTISVYNIIGKKVFEAKGLNKNKLMLNLQNSETGIYLLRIETETGIIVERITINKI